MAAIPQHQRVGGNAYLSYNSETGRYSFVYMNDSNQWMVDTYTPRMIHEGRMRFYRLRLTPQWYSGYSFATVADNATLVLYNVINNADVEDQVQNFPNNTTVGQEDVRSTNDPVEDDRQFREQRDGIHVVPPPPPPQPPGGGAVAADRAESRPRQEQPAALVALAAALEWPALAAEPAGAGGAGAAGAGENSSALELLTALLENARHRVHNQEQPQNSLLRALELLDSTTDRHPWDVNPALLTPRNQPIRNLYENENEYTPPRRRRSIPRMGENGYGVYVPRYEPAILNIFNDNFIDYHNDRNQAPAVASHPLKRVADTMLEAAITKGETCPISLEPITKDSVCVAPCYHCFDKPSIQEWLGRNESCPTCRIPCTL